MRKLKLLVIVLLPMLLGIYVRFNDVPVWNKYKSYFYYNDKPLFTSYDAFKVARFAKDWKDGTYKPGKRDPLMFYPDNYITDNITYPSTIPMESFLGGFISKLDHEPVENVAFWLSPLLAILFVIPLGLYLFRMDLPVSAFSGSLVGVVSLIYLVRTSIMRFDTDSLNLFFPFLIAYLFFEYFNVKSRRLKLLILALAGLSNQAYNWWYAHSGLVLIMVGLFLFVDFVVKRFKFDRNDLIDILVLLLFSNPLMLWNGIFNFMGSFRTYIINYFHPSVSGFPNVFMSISEAKHVDLSRLAALTVGNNVVFLLGLIGMIILLIKEYKRLVFMLPPLLIGLMSFKGGNRFGMYLAPFLGMGLGFLFDYTFFLLKGNIKPNLKHAFDFLGMSLCLIIVVFSSKMSFAFVAQPKITPRLDRDFTELSKITPKDSCIWTWWDYGYAIEYLADRATFHDGGSQGSPKTYFVARSFSTPNATEAHNIMLSISNIGTTGIDKLTNQTSSEIVANEISNGRFLKPLSRPVYWAFTGDEIGKFAWINYFGTWNFKLKRGLKEGIFKFVNCRPKGKLLVCGNGVSFDLSKGFLLPNMVPLNTLYVKEGNKTSVKNYHESGLYLEVVGPYVFLMDEEPFKSMFNQMYILRNYDPRYFKLVLDDFPTMVLYRVNGEG